MVIANANVSRVSIETKMGIFTMENNLVILRALIKNKGFHQKRNSYAEHASVVRLNKM